MRDLRQDLCAARKRTRPQDCAPANKAFYMQARRLWQAVHAAGKSQGKICVQRLTFVQHCLLPDIGLCFSPFDQSKILLSAVALSWVYHSYSSVSICPMLSSIVMRTPVPKGKRNHHPNSTTSRTKTNSTPQPSATSPTSLPQSAKATP